MLTMARKKKPKPVSPKWAKSFTALQERLAASNDEMAEKFGVGVRTYLSWKYGERNPSPTGAKLLEILSK